jgi:TolB-like protein
MSRVISLPGYRIERELGHGGMATVYLAVQDSLGRQVALKVLHAQFAADPAVARRFLREGRVAANLHHRHIVAIHDVGEHGGQPYMALEYLPLGSIEPLCGRAGLDAALRCVREIAGALDAAHRKGIVHRDVKPENILRHADGAFMLSDFGIAQVYDDGAAITREGMAIGTPAYMSPEQWRGDAVDGRADLYGLGVVFHQLLTGHVPYAATDPMAVGMLHLHAPIPRLPAEFAGAQPLLDGLLAKQPAARIGSGVEAARLAAEIASEPAGTTTSVLPTPAPAIAAAPPSPPTLPKAGRTGPPRAWWLAGPVAALALGVLLAWRPWAAPGATSEAKPAVPSPAAVAVEATTVAVLPCTNWLRDERLAWLGEGLADELIHRLGRLKVIKVIGRASSFPLAGDKLTAPEIGRRLGAGMLVTCSLREAPGGVRVVAELTDTTRQTQRWALQFERPPERILGAIDEIAVGIAEGLLTSVVGEERALLVRHDTDSLEALRLYQASIPLSESWTRETLAQADAMLKRALELDPQFARAHQSMALLWMDRMQVDNVAFATAAPHIDAALEEALRLDPELGDAFAVRCQVDTWRYDWAKARADCDEALRLAPNSGRVRYLLGQYEYAFGDPALGVLHASRFRDLEPGNPFAWQNVSAAYTWGGQPERGLLEADRAGERFPGNWVTDLMRAIAFLELRRCDEAVAAFERIEAVEPNLEFTGVLGAAYACAGRRKEALAMRDRLRAARAGPRHVSESNLALTELELGNHQAAIDALEAAYANLDQSTTFFLAREMLGLERLRGNPRYDALRAKYDFPNDRRK